MSLSRPPSPSEDLDAVKVLDHLVRRAVSMGASDIHVEPKRDGIRVRYRVDGVMVAQGQIPLEIAPSLTSRVKVLAKMDMTERRLPQDGQFSLELHGHPLIHLRASTFPAIHGETLVLRVLLSHQLIPLEKRHPIPELMEALRAFDAAGGKRITFEYTMIKGVNDDPALAAQLATMAASLQAFVNLIPFNPIPYRSWEPSPPASIRAFQKVLTDRGVSCAVREPRGRDIDAACGQLRAKAIRESGLPVIGEDGGERGAA